MRRLRLVLSVLCLLASHFPAALPEARAALVLSEILAAPARDWDGSGAFSSRDDEWVEVRNTSDLPLDLTGWLITDGDSLPRYALSGVLAPHAALLITGRMSYDWERAAGFPAFGLSLGNSGDAVVLWQVVGADTLVRDAYTYKAHESAADRSTGRVLGSDAWTVFDALNPYTGTATPQGNGCAPSPGTPNACGSTSARAVTWGRVKTLYRE
jgi:hypothetical protein